MKKKLHSFIVLISLSINKSNQSVLLSLKVVVWREINGVSVMRFIGFTAYFTPRKWANCVKIGIQGRDLICLFWNLIIVDNM